MCLETATFVCVFNQIRDRFKVSIDFYSNKQKSCEKWVFLKNVRELRIRLAGKYHHFLRSPSNSQSEGKNI